MLYRNKHITLTLDFESSYIYRQFSFNKWQHSFTLIDITLGNYYCIIVSFFENWWMKFGEKFVSAFCIVRMTTEIQKVVTITHLIHHWHWYRCVTTAVIWTWGHRYTNLTPLMDHIYKCWFHKHRSKKMKQFLELRCLCFSYRTLALIHNLCDQGVTTYSASNIWQVFTW